MRTTFSWWSRWRPAVASGTTWLLLVAGFATSAQAQAPPPPDAAAPVTYQTFYDALSPYGQWVSDPDYGYAWVPTAGADFQPYRTNGHWVYTDYGWTWVSDYSWGWAPFHYGRWRYSDGYSWLWVPGYSWGPAWVAWRQSQGYYGWAPLGPPPLRRGVHLTIGFSFSFGDAPVAPARWCFVPAAYVTSPRLATYYVPPTQTTVVYNQTTVIHNTYVNNTINNTQNTMVVNNPGQRRGAGGQEQPAFPAGPAPAEVAKATGQPVQSLAVANRATPGVGVQGHTLAFYRPAVVAPPAAASSTEATPSGRRGTPTAAIPAPRAVVSLPEAVRQARAVRPDAAPGLVCNAPAQQLSSTEAHPFRAAQAAASVGPTTNNSGSAATGRRNRMQPAGAATSASSPASQPNALPNAATLPAGSSLTTPPTDAAARQLTRQQRQQAPTSQLQGISTPPQAFDAQQRRQLNQQDRLARQQQVQQMQLQRQAQQQVRQQRQLPPQMRQPLMPRPQGEERRR